MRQIYLNQALLDDGEFQGLSKPAQRAFFFLRLDRRVGLSGVGRIGLPGLQTLLDEPPERTQAILSELGQKPWVVYDQEAETVWIVGAYRLEPNSLPVRVGAVRELRNCRSADVVQRWIERYQPRWREGSEHEKAQLDALLADCSDTVARRSRHGAYTPKRGSKTVSVPPGNGSSTVLARDTGPDRTVPDRKGRYVPSRPREGSGEGVSAGAPTPVPAAEPEGEPEPIPNRQLTPSERARAIALRARLANPTSQPR